MKDLVSPFNWHMFLRRRTRVSRHDLDFAAEALFLELKRCLALAVKKEIRIQLHTVLLVVFSG
jgi:hypothetical protein